MAAQKYGEPLVTSYVETPQYHHRWVFTAGVWTNEPYEYRMFKTIEYRQPCDGDYAAEAIGAPGGDYEQGPAIKTTPFQGFSELVTQWKSKANLTWLAYPRGS